MESLKILWEGTALAEETETHQGKWLRPVSFGKAASQEWTFLGKASLWLSPQGLEEILPGWGSREDSLGFRAVLAHVALQGGLEIQVREREQVVWWAATRGSGSGILEAGAWPRSSKGLPHLEHLRAGVQASLQPPVWVGGHHYGCPPPASTQSKTLLIIKWPHCVRGVFPMTEVVGSSQRNC